MLSPMGLNAKAIGLKIQEARVAKGLTQGQLAKALGIDRGSVGRWETGRSVPRQVGIPKIAQLLGTTAERLLEGSSEVNLTSENIEVLRAERRTLKEIRSEIQRLARESKVKVHASTARSTTPLLKAQIDRKALEDILLKWNSAKPEARWLAALLITGDWSYKLKLMNREVTVDQAVLQILGSITA